MSRTTRVLALFAVVTGSAFGQRPGEFRVVGPGGGGAMFHPAVSPHDASTALVACDMTGSYVTHDGGSTWRMFNLRGAVRFFVFDPTLPRVIYAGNEALWRSRDDGETWELVFPRPATIKGVSMASDHSDERIVSAGEPEGPITAMAIDRSDSKRLYAAEGGAHPALFVSEDAGAHWRRGASLPEAASKMWMAAKGSHGVLITGPKFVVTVEGERVEQHDAPAEIKDTSAGWRPGSSWMVYTASEAGVSVSADGGATWTAAALPGTGARVRAIATSFGHPETAYASYSELHLGGAVWHGVARTLDAGKSWELVWKESGTAAANIHDAWITERFGTDWGENPLDLGVAEQDPNLVFGTDFGRTLISTDGGVEWHAAYSRRAADGGWTSTGLDVTTDYGVHFDPFDSRREFITYTDVSLFRSETAGASWVSSSSGIPAKWLNTTYWMAFDPEVKGRVWAVASGTHDLPRPKMWRHTSTDAFRGGVVRSEDGGRTWAVSNAGMPETAPTDIVLDPASAKGGRTLYVTAFGRGVYKSVDDGRSWTLKKAGIAQASPLAWRIRLAPDHSLYLVIARRSEDGSIGNGGDGALYRSTDGAESWHAIRLPNGVNGPNGVEVDPVHPAHLYLAAWARAVGMHGEGGGVYQSEDFGQHWTVSLSRDQHVYDVTVDPRLPGTVYAAGFESSAWVSRDAGGHWKRIAGFDFKWGNRVVLDPKDPSSVYITTFGGGVWHGSVTTEAAVLDIATPEMEVRP